MADINAKFVRILAPGGVTLNFTGITGNSYKAAAMPVTLIKKALDRGAKVYELIEEKDKEGNVTGYSEVELTEENYTTDNGGKVVEPTNNVVPDIEKERIETHEAEFQARLEQKGLEIKERQEALVAEVLGTAETTIEGGTTEATIEGGAEPATIEGGTTEATIEGGAEPATIEGGTTEATIEGGAEPMQEGEENGSGE